MHKFEQIQNTLFVTLSLRRHIPLFISQGFILIVIIVGYFLLPVLELGIIGIELYSAIAAVILLIIVGVALERILFTKSFKIQFSTKNLEYTYGVFYKTVESVDMHMILDYVKKRGPFDQLLGIANIVIHSEDIRTPLITFHGLLVDDARAIIEYLQNNAANTIVEYLKNKSGDRGTGRESSHFDAMHLNDLQMLQDKENTKRNKLKASTGGNEP